MNNKVKSFTLSEMLVVMVITVIIVGIAFTVLNLVRKQIKFIETNFSKTTELALCKQQLWQDFNQHSQIWFNAKEQRLILISDIDTINYSFSKEYLLRQKDTIKTKLELNTIFFEGNEVNEGWIDAMSFSASHEIPDYVFFVFKQNDASLFMNNDGF